MSAPPPAQARDGARRGRLCRYAGVVAAILVTAPIVYHLARGSLAYLGLFEDDYFYYAIIADKLVRLGRLTYDGVTATNGFHPLWFLVVLALRAATGGLGAAFYVLLSVVFLGSMVASFELTRRFAASLGAGAGLGSAVALVHAVGTFRVVSSGMETALDVPLLLWLLLELSRPSPLSPRRAARLGLLASLAVLSRLDLALLVAMGLAGWLAVARPPLARAARIVGAFAAAGAAVPVYALANLALFGSVLPVSALAKQLVTRPGVNLQYLRAVAFYTPYGRTAGVTMVLGVVALVVLLRRRRGASSVVRPEALFAGGLSLAFAGVFFLANALSGWIYFGWYAYPMAPALAASLTWVGLAVAPWVRASLREWASRWLVVGAAVLAIAEGADYFVTRGLRGRVEDNGLLAMSVELKELMKAREGVVAMGAVGGFATYLLDRPVVQLEGLTEDRAMVEHIAREDDLVGVLREHHVDYLVVTLHSARMDPRDGCYEVTEPNAEWSGARVRRMRGEICAEPIARFPTRIQGRRWASFRALDTFVFDVRGLGAKSVAPAPPAPAPAIVARPYGLSVPTSYRAGSPAPLVVALHGLRGNGEWISNLLDLPALSERRGFLFAFPQGTPSARLGRFWNATDACCDFDGTAVDDVAYLRAILDDVGARYSVDPARVYLTGLSNGGYLSHRAACDLADRVAAIVSLSGANWKDAERCQPSEPVSVLEVHADHDTVVVYDGRTFEIDGREHTIPSAHETVATWAKRDGCGGELAPYGAPVDWDSSVPGAETTREAYAGCPPGTAVELWTVHGGEHVPGPGPSMGALAVDFMLAHPKPGR